MKIRSLKTNYVLNILRIATSTLVGVFTMPYINNTLGPSSLGKVEYVYTIINYFILFSALGIPIYGVRQIAKIRNNKDELSKTLIEILIVLIFTSMIAYIILFSILFSTELFINYKDLIFLMSSMIILNNLGAEWFFQGIEDQLYITIRYLIIRLITLILLFVLVKGPDDYLYYGLIVILNVCGSNFLNFYRLKKYINFQHLNFQHLNFQRHIKPSLTILIASISISIYLQIDTFLLGYLTSDKYVGLYSVSNKLLRYVITFILSIGAVLLPRLSNLWEIDKLKYYDYLIRAFNLLLLISIPFSLYFYFFSNNIIFIMGGEKFKDAEITLKILSPICVFVALAYFFGYLVLYTQGKEKLYTISVSISAMVSIFLNYYLINKYQQNGAALTQLISEVLGILIILIFIQRNKSLRMLISKNFYKILSVNLFLLLISFSFFNELGFSSLYYFLINSFIYGAIYLILLIFIRENSTRYIIDIFKKKIYLVWSRYK